jgi:hypothetical protein
VARQFFWGAIDRPISPILRIQGKEAATEAGFLEDRLPTVVHSNALNQARNADSRGTLKASRTFLEEYP